MDFGLCLAMSSRTEIWIRARNLGIKGRNKNRKLIKADKGSLGMDEHSQKREYSPYLKI